ncbi:MauE/DoxX family redox-associated membrane protein [Catellatospora bangladeshensis]|uniref:MauE/DoxX family redox-associated membrane protein n=1 Tax=Catellatospora bangladeshensis TaxID=310355 RepID=UPI00361C8BED
MAWALLVTGQLLLAGVLAFSAGAKLLDPGAYAAFRASLPANLRLPERLAGPLAAAVVTAEAVLAGLLALAVAVPALAPGALLATTALLTTFTAALAAMVRRGVRQACHCFGTATRPPGPADVVRNLVLLAVSASATAAAWPAPPPPPAPNGAAMPHLPAILALLAAVCVLNTGLIVLVLRLLRQQTVLVRASIEGVANPEPIMTAGGGRVAAFTAVTVDGEPLSADQLDGDTLVGFLSPAARPAPRACPASSPAPRSSAGGSGCWPSCSGRAAPPTRCASGSRRSRGWSTSPSAGRCHAPSAWTATPRSRCCPGTPWWPATSCWTRCRAAAPGDRDARLLGAAVRLAATSAPRWLAARIALAAAAAGVPVLAAWLMKTVLDRVVAPGAPVLVPVLLLALSGVAAVLVPELGRYADAELQRRIGLTARERLYAAVGRMGGLRAFENPRFHDRLSLAAEVGPTGPAEAVTSAIGVATGAATAAAFLAALLTINPWMLLVVLAAALPTLRAELRLSRHRAETLGELGRSTRREFFYAQLMTSVTAAKEVRLFGLAGLFGARMLGELRRIHAGHRRMERRELAVQCLQGCSARPSRGPGWSGPPTRRGPGG